MTPTLTRPLRRRLDKRVLRWQARLDSEWSDRVLPWILAIGLFVVLELLSFAKVRSLETNGDFAVMTQGVWLIRHGGLPSVTLGFGGNLLAQQASFVLFPVGGLAALAGVQPALLLLQSAALALGIVPVWRIARNLARLRVGGAATLAFVYALYPTLHNLNLAGFYADTLALPGLLYAAYFGLSHHWKRYVVCCVFVVLCRGDLGLAVAGLGALLWVEGRKTEGRATLIGGTAYALVAAMVLQPLMGNGSFPHLEAFASFGSTPFGVIWGLVSQPGVLISQLVREQNFQLFVLLFAPVVFLPLIAPRYLLPALPLQFFFLITNVPHNAVFGRQTVAITAFIFLATAHALAKVGRMGVERVVVDRRLLALILGASTVFFIQGAASSPYRQPWAWGARDAADGARLRAGQLIGADRAVRASATVTASVAERVTVFELPSTDRPDAAVAGNDVDAVILDTRTQSSWNTVDVRVFDDGLNTLGFRRVQDDFGVMVWIRGP